MLLTFRATEYLFPMLMAVIAATVLTAPLTFLLLRLYRRTVLKWMRQPSGQTAPVSVPLPAGAVGSASGRPDIEFSQAVEGTQSPAARAMTRRMGWRPWRTGAVYFCGWVIGICVMLTIYVLLFGPSIRVDEPSITSAELLFREAALWIELLVAFLFPAVWVVLLVVLNDRLFTSIGAAIYLGVSLLCPVFVMTLLGGNALIAAGLWFFLFLVPMLLVAGLLYRGMQGVAPMVYLFLFISILAGLLFGVLFLKYFPWLPDFILAMPLFLGMLLISPFMMVIGLPVGAGMVFLLGWLYRRRWVSEMGLMIDSLWLIFGFYSLFLLAAESDQSFLIGLVAVPACFVLYKLFSTACFYAFRSFDRRQTGMPAQPLLFLRVFSLGKRSEQLYGAISRPWHYAGSIRLIIGPDLAASTAGPGLFVDFVSGRLRRQFIDCSTTLDRQLGTLPPVPDLDGTHRLAEFLCYDDTWQLVLSRLAEHVLVLLDLRQFCPANKGCIFEITALLERVPLPQIVFVVDATTDMAFLRQTVETAWAGVNASSPNHGATRPQLTLFPYAGQRQEYGRLLRMLARMAVASRP